MIDLILKLKTRRCEKRRPRKQLTEYSRVNRVTVLCDLADFEVVDGMVRGLEADGKEVRVWSFSELTDSGLELPAAWKVLNNKQLNFFFVPGKELMAEFAGFDSELLLDLSRRPNPVLEYLEVCSPSGFKAGFKTDRPSRYDFVLTVPEGEGDLAQNAGTLLFYLKGLRLK